MKPIVRTLLLAAIVALMGAAFAAEAVADDASAKDLFKTAMKQFNKDRYSDAADQFRRVFNEYEKSEYAADAMYWYSYAMLKLDGRANLRNARAQLEQAKNTYSRRELNDDTDALYQRIQSRLASIGDSDAAEWVSEQSEKIGEDRDLDDMETKIYALEGLMNMNEERALPILKKVLSDRRDSHARLREKAMFLLSQHQSEESVDILMDSAKNDPNAEVREKAVFWMSQTQSPRVTKFLEELALNNGDQQIQEKAIFALSQHNSDGSSEILRRIAKDPNVAHELRAKSIFWLGQRKDTGPFLITLFDEVDDDELKEKVLFSVSQSGDGEAAKFLVSVAKDKKHPTEVRKQALFWAGQQDHISTEDLVTTYQTVTDREFREHVIFVMSQQRGDSGLDAMIKLARKERDPELKKKFLFWIGQSNSQKAADFLEAIINE